MTIPVALMIAAGTIGSIDGLYYPSASSVCSRARFRARSGVRPPCRFP